MGLASASVIASVASLSRAFLLFGCRSVTVRGLDRFLRILHSEARRQSRTGLLTYANHISVLDEPLLWGSLPFTRSGTQKLIAAARAGPSGSAGSDGRSTQEQQHSSPFLSLDPAANARWTLAASDILYLNNALRAFFNTGQVLETHRGGSPFQPALDSAISQLDRGHWVHIFPEGYVNLSRSTELRRFKWGISRLAMEAERAPVCLPIWITGFDHVMPEPRAAPRWLPRPGARISVTFGKPVRRTAMRSVFRADSRCIGAVPPRAPKLDAGEAARKERERVYWDEAWEPDEDALGEPEAWEIESGYAPSSSPAEDVRRLAADTAAKHTASTPPSSWQHGLPSTPFPPIPPHKPPAGGWPTNAPDSRAARALQLEGSDTGRGKVRSEFAAMLREEMGRLGLCVQRAMGDGDGAGRLAHTIMSEDKEM